MYESLRHRPRSLAYLPASLAVLGLLAGLAETAGTARAQSPASPPLGAQESRVPPPRKFGSLQTASPPGRQAPGSTQRSAVSVSALPPRALPGEVLQLRAAPLLGVAGDPSARRASTADVEPAPSVPARPAPTAGGQFAVPTKAIAKFNGTAAPGLKLELDATSSLGEDLRFSWLQTRGPKIEVERPDSPRLRVTVPGDASELAFVLFASGRGGTDRSELVIPLVLHPGAGRAASLVADAGDDQVAIVNHRVTLNGLRSRQLTQGGEPSSPANGKLAYRWVQVSGPAVPLLEQSWVCIFTPREPGLYRFLLVVAANGEISQPDAVDVWVTSQVPRELAEASTPELETTTSRVSAGLRTIPGGLAKASELAVTFEDVSRRMGLYTAYQDVQLDLSRRLLTIIPAGESARAAWEASLVIPLSQAVIRTMAATGLDLSSPDADATPLDEIQKKQLGALFLQVARGFRAAAGLPLETNPEAAPNAVPSTVGSGPG